LFARLCAPRQQCGGEDRPSLVLVFERRLAALHLNLIFGGRLLVTMWIGLLLHQEGVM